MGTHGSRACGSFDVDSRGGHVPDHSAGTGRALALRTSERPVRTSPLAMATADPYLHAAPLDKTLSIRKRLVGCGDKERLAIQQPRPKGVFFWFAQSPLSYSAADRNSGLSQHAISPGVLGGGWAPLATITRCHTASPNPRENYRRSRYFQQNNAENKPSSSEAEPPRMARC